MIDLNHIDDLARRLSALVPPGLRDSGEELQASFRSALQAGLGKLDLVTREEFDVQRAVLVRTPEKLEASPVVRRVRVLYPGAANGGNGAPAAAEEAVPPRQLLGAVAGANHSRRLF